MRKPRAEQRSVLPLSTGYSSLVGGIGQLLEAARRTSARAVNALMTATYWDVGRRIVEFEQDGTERAHYGEALLERLSVDLTARFGRGFSQRNLQDMRLFYLAYPPRNIWQTLSAKSHSAPQIPAGEIYSAGKKRTASAELTLSALAASFPLPWSAYVRLFSLKNEHARQFYETEALRGGWSVRQLDRQIDSLFYERTALSRNKVSMLEKGAKRQPSDTVTADEEVKDPLVLEFLGLRDEYSESDIEDGIIHHLETFLLELGNDFAFIARQRRLRIDNEWFRIDLLLYHSRLRCLVILDLKLGRFSHADAGQMHLYLNYATQHWTQPDENPPVGVILCSGKGESLVRYATDNLPSKVLVREYLTALPDEKQLAKEIAAARKQIEARHA